jgi:hypothetical protein
MNTGCVNSKRVPWPNSNGLPKTKTDRWDGHCGKWLRSLLKKERRNKGLENTSDSTNDDSIYNRSIGTKVPNGTRAIAEHVDPKEAWRGRWGSKRRVNK